MHTGLFRVPVGLVLVYNVVDSECIYGSFVQLSGSFVRISDSFVRI